MNNRLNKLEKSWILYDVANSAFILLVSTIMPIYFRYLGAESGVSASDCMVYWGYAASVVTLIVAVLGPVLGALADMKDFKKPVFTVMLLLGVAGCMLLGFMQSWIWFLGIFVLTKVGYSTGIIFYDAMLTDVTTEERMDRLSSLGYAWGYIGSCVPFVISLALVLGAGKSGITSPVAMAGAFTLTGIWWLIMSVPLIRQYRQKFFVEKMDRPVRTSFTRLKTTFHDIRKDKKVLLYLLSFFFYIDGVYTIIDMATAYGESLGLDSTGLLIALLVTQIVAFPSAILLGRFARRFRAENLISVCILAYLGIAVFAIQLNTQAEFWILAIAVGMFQGTIQALSRSYFAKIIPKEKAGEYFGIMDICGKGASFLGTTMVAFFTQITGSSSAGVSVLTIFFIAGFLIFRKSVSVGKEKEERLGKEKEERLEKTKKVLVAR